MQEMWKMAALDPTSEADEVCSQKKTLVLEAYLAVNNKQDLILRAEQVLQARWSLDISAKICFTSLG